MNGKMKKSLSLGLIGISCVFLIIGCTRFKNFLGWSKPSDSSHPLIYQFMSNMRSHYGNPDSHYLLACYYQERGRHKEALQEFGKVLLIEPTYVKAYNGVGVSNDLLGDFDTAIQYYRMALNLSPNLDYVYNNMGYSYLLRGNLDEAISSLKKAISINHQDQRFHNNLGLAYGEKGEYDLALAEFKLAGDEAKAHQNMAQLYFKKGLLEEAKSHYGMALKLNPSLTVARTALKAADALVRIFEPPSNKTELKNLVIPDPLTVQTVETKEPIPSAQLGIANSEVGNVEGRDQPASENSETIRMVNIDPPPMETLSKEREEVSFHPKIEIQHLSSLKEAKIEISNGNGAYPMAKKEAKIEISNGNGSYGMAKKVGDYLKEKGFKVARYTNANHFNHSGTKIFFQKEYDEEADHIAKHLPSLRSKKEIEKFDRPNIKIKVLIGKDLIPYNQTFENGKKS